MTTSEAVTTHTPGPWNVFDSGERPGIDAARISIIVYGVGRDSLGVHGANRGEALANARLISAAPMLKETNYALAMMFLQSSLYRTDPDVREAVDAALAANAIAEGRTP